MCEVVTAIKPTICSMWGTSKYPYKTDNFSTILITYSAAGTWGSKDGEG
jgi:hypothetical protein